MALITRVSRLFRADLHAVLDRIEEPDLLLRQAVREMEEDLAGDEQRVKLLKHEHGQLVSRQKDTEESLNGIDEELDVCFASQNDDLARALIKRKLEAQHFHKALERKRQALAKTLGALNTRIDENRSRLESMRQKAELLGEQDTPGHQEADWSTPGTTVRDEDVEVAFLREKQKRSRP
jgi:phage shock protein A